MNYVIISDLLGLDKIRIETFERKIDFVLMRPDVSIEHKNESRLLTIANLNFNVFAPGQS